MLFRSSEIFDSDISKDFVYDYLSNGEYDADNDDGIRKITGQDFADRIRSETLKNFDSTDDAININFAENNILLNDNLENTSFTYLSPSRIDAPKKSYVLSKRKKTSKNKPAVQLKKIRNIENTYETRQDIDAKLLEIKSEIINSSITGYANQIKPVLLEEKKTSSSKDTVKQIENKKSNHLTDNNYLDVLSRTSGATFEKNFIRVKSPPRVITSDTKQDNKNKSSIIVKDKVDNNTQTEYEYVFAKNSRQ